MQNFSLRSGIVLGVLITISLVSCGGGGDSDDETAETSGTTEKVAGQFIDATVGGLAYTCSSGDSGLTDNNGKYTCDKDDTVTFSINNFVLGSAAASEVITPLNIVSDNEQAVNVAQLLQTLDVDDDPSNGISVAQFGVQYDAMASMAEDDVSLDQADFDSAAGLYIDEPLVDEITAENHLNDSIAGLNFNAESIKAALAGNYVYPSMPTPANSEEWSVAVDGLTGTVTGVDEYGAYSGNLTITYTDTSFTVEGDDPDDVPVTFTVTAITDRYVQTEFGNIYYSQEEAYTDAIIAAFAGENVYPQQVSLSVSEEWNIDASGTTVTVNGVDEQGEHVDHVTATYSGATFTLTNQDIDDPDYGVSVTFSVSDITTTEVTITDGVGNESGIFYSQDEAYVDLLP